LMSKSIRAKPQVPARGIPGREKHHSTVLPLSAAAEHLLV
jgi:hypothetical protein